MTASQRTFKTLWLHVLTSCDTQTEGAEDSGRLQEIEFTFCSAESQRVGPGATPLEQKVGSERDLKASRVPAFVRLS